MAISDELFSARVKRKAKLGDVASLCGLTRLDVWQFERGIRRPSDEEIERLSIFFGCDFKDDGEILIDLLF